MSILQLVKQELLSKTLTLYKQHGQIKVNGEVWSAMGENDVNISQGTEIEIKEIKGVKAIVAPIQK